MRTMAEVVPYPSGGTSMTNLQQLSTTDLQQLIEKYQRRMADLEAQIAALRHKHDVLVEASRLLEEEPQTPDVSSH